MQSWSSPEKTIILTDLLRSPQQQRDVVYVKPEPKFVSSRPGLVELPPLLPPRAPMLPAISDVFRTTGPQQRYQETTSVNLTPPTTGLPSPVRDPQLSTYSATFINRPNTLDNRLNGFVLPNLPSTISSYTGDMTPPGLIGARTRPTVQSPRGTSSQPASRMCKMDGCNHYVVDHRLCVRHGGGKRCTAEGCTSRAKHFGRCWKHGGSIECKAPGCSNRAKSRGYCWSHGGGTKCKIGDCDKIAISNGLCWAHGGGKRCIVSGCRKQAYERTCNYCNSHFQQYQQTALKLAQHQPALK